MERFAVWVAIREAVGIAGWAVLEADDHGPAVPVVNIQPCSVPFPCRVKLTRIGPNRRAMDGDGLQAALKHVRDQVAAWLGVDDADARITWSYWQERSKEYGVRIEVTQGGEHG